MTDSPVPSTAPEPLGTVVPSSVPTHWYNLAADLPEPPPPALHPGTREPLVPDDLAPLFPMALIMQEVTADRYVEIPQAVREVYALWRPVPPDPGAPPGARPGHARQDLLQVRGRQPGRLAQAEHGRRTGLLQRGGGHHQAHHRDGRRAVGGLLVDGLRAVRPRVRGLAGARLLRLQAVPPHADGDVRRECHPSPSELTRPVARCWPQTRTPPGRSGWRSARRSRPQPPTHGALLARAACSTTCCCTRR